MSAMLDWALHYATQGLSIIPVKGKTPLVQWKQFQERRANEQELRAWWNQWPDADIGMVTGRISNRFVIDFDGEEAHKAFIEAVFPITYEVRTKRGKQLHFLFPKDFTGKTTLAGIAPLVDTRGEGGYVKLPPSAYSDGSGRYTATTTPDRIAELPDWFFRILKEENAPREPLSTGDSWLEEKLNGLKDGNRNDTFTSIAGSLRSRGYTDKDIFIFLEPHARTIDFPLDELRTISESVGSYPTKVVDENAESFSKFLEHQEKIEWLLPGIIARNSLNFTAGWPMTAKTWMLMDLAIEAAKGGGWWLGKFPTKKAKVLFIDQERFRGETQRRFKALLAAKNLAAASLKDNIRVKCGSTIRLNLQQSFDAFRRELAEYRPDLVIVDSFATFHTAAENDRMEIQKVLELVKQLRTEFGCAFIFINHENKGIMNKADGEEHRMPSMTDMAGSIGIPAAAEAMLTVRRKDSNTCVVYMTKNNLAPVIDPFEVVVEDLDVEKTKIRVRAF